MIRLRTAILLRTEILLKTTPKETPHTPASPKKEANSRPASSSPRRIKGALSSYVPYPSSTRYIPLTLTHPQWQAEIITHVEADALACCVYHNGSFYEIAIDHKPKRLPSMLGCGVVLTTYDSCVAAYANDGRRENWLYETQWKRIVIDEGHIIKNEKWG